MRFWPTLNMHSVRRQHLEQSLSCIQKEAELTLLLWHEIAFNTQAAPGAISELHPEGGRTNVTRVAWNCIRRTGSTWSNPWAASRRRQSCCPLMPSCCRSFLSTTTFASRPGCLRQGTVCTWKPRFALYVCFQARLFMPSYGVHMKTTVCS